MPRTTTIITYNNFPAIIAAIPREAGQIVEKHLLGVESEAKQMMAGPKSGSVYGGHIASAPGEPPAIDTGALFNSITHEMETQTSGATYTNMEYAAHLEFGTIHMAARPFFAPAAERVRPDFVDDMRDLESRLPK